MDLTSGYHQLGLADEASRFTAFKTHRDMYKFKRIPFGLKGAPSYFQRMMSSVVLSGLVGNICEIYIDDVIVFDDTFNKTFAKFFRDLKNLT